MSEQPQVPWVMYLDADAMFIENKSLSENPVESILTANNDTHPDSFLFLPSMGVGWNTDFIFVLNNARSRAFMDYVWKLAQHCPKCVGEQCAVNLAFRDLLLFQANKSLSEHPGAVDPWLHVSYDGNVRGSCCEIMRYCEWPRGRSSFHNPSHWSAVQGCTWNWEKVLRWVDNVDAPNEPEEHNLYYYVNRKPYRELLGIHHPVKTKAECILKGGANWGDLNSTTKDFCDEKNNTKCSNDTSTNITTNVININITISSDVTVSSNVSNVSLSSSSSIISVPSNVSANIITAKQNINTLQQVMKEPEHAVFVNLSALENYSSSKNNDIEANITTNEQQTATENRSHS